MTTCPTCDTQDRDASMQGGGLSRRGFLAGLGAAGAAAAASPLISTRVAFAADPNYGGDTVVVISMRGGMDGLSVVVPAGDPDYAASRPTIKIPVSQLLAYDGLFGLHPSMAPLLPMWQNGTFGAVHAVGQTNPTRSHFEAMEVMEQAAPGSSVRTGWLDRALGLRSAGSVFQAVQLGNSLPSSAFKGSSPELALGAVDDFVLWAADSDDPVKDAASIARWSTALRALHVGAPASLAAPTEAAVGAVTTTSSMKRAGYTPANGAVYDAESRLAMALRDVARLIKQGVGLQIACIDYGDWDMHADLGTFDNGWMKDKLTEVASALAAFATDLGPALNNVTVVTMSEFGRRIDENGSGGVDHGHGNAMLLLGGGVNGGQVHGPWPSLADDARDDGGDLYGATDYRTVLAEILRRRCGQGDVSSIFPGLASGDLGVVKTRPT
jgi:uncharacterized protein (DUF1501 family)